MLRHHVLGEAYAIKNHFITACSTLLNSVGLTVVLEAEGIVEKSRIRQRQDNVTCMACLVALTRAK